MPSFEPSARPSISSRLRHRVLAVGVGALLLVPAMPGFAQDQTPGTPRNKTTENSEREQNQRQRDDRLNKRPESDQRERRGEPFGRGFTSHPERAHEFMKALKAIKPELADTIEKTEQLPPEERGQAIHKMLSQLSDAERQEIRGAVRKMLGQHLSADGLSGRPGPGNGGGGKWLNDENFDELVGILQEIRPDWAQTITELREKDRRGFYEALYRNPELKKLAGLVALKESAPETYAMRLTELKLSIQMQKLGYQAHLAKQSGDVEAIAASQVALRETVEQYFDARIRLRMHEIQQVRQQLERMEQSITAAESQRSESISEKVSSLLSDDAFKELKKAQGPMQGPREGPREGNNGQKRWSSHDEDTRARWREKQKERGGMQRDDTERGGQTETPQ